MKRKSKKSLPPDLYKALRPMRYQAFLIGFLSIASPPKVTKARMEKYLQQVSKIFDRYYTEKFAQEMEAINQEINRTP